MCVCAYGVWQANFLLSASAPFTFVEHMHLMVIIWVRLDWIGLGKALQIATVCSGHVVARRLLNRREEGTGTRLRRGALRWKRSRDKRTLGVEGKEGTRARMKGRTGHGL